jgi:hypothetical protein
MFLRSIRMLASLALAAFSVSSPALVEMGSIGCRPGFHGKSTAGFCGPPVTGSLLFTKGDQSVLRMPAN